MTQAQATTDFVSLKDFRAAAERIAPVARITPLVDVSGPAGRPFFLKCESLQPAGAFKIRGAYNMVAQLDPAQREAGDAQGQRSGRFVGAAAPVPACTACCMSSTSMISVEARSSNSLT